MIQQDVQLLFQFSMGKKNLWQWTRKNFHGKTEKSNETSHQITSLFFYLSIKINNAFNLFSVLYETDPYYLLACFVAYVLFCMRVETFCLVSLVQ